MSFSAHPRFRFGSPGRFCRATAPVARAGGAPALQEEEHENKEEQKLI